MREKWSAGHVHKEPMIYPADENECTFIPLESIGVGYDPSLYSCPAEGGSFDPPLPISTEAQHQQYYLPQGDLPTLQAPAEVQPQADLVPAPEVEPPPEMYTFTLTFPEIIETDKGTIRRNTPHSFNVPCESLDDPSQHEGFKQFCETARIPVPTQIKHMQKYFVPLTTENVLNNRIPLVDSQTLGMLFASEPDKAAERIRGAHNVYLQNDRTIIIQLGNGEEMRIERNAHQKMAETFALLASLNYQPAIAMLEQLSHSNPSVWNTLFDQRYSEESGGIAEQALEACIMRRAYEQEAKEQIEALKQKKAEEAQISAQTGEGKRNEAGQQVAEKKEITTLEAWKTRSLRQASIIVGLAEVGVDAMNDDARWQARKVMNTYGYELPDISAPPQDPMVIQMNRARTEELTEAMGELRTERVHVEGDQVIAAAGLMYGFDWKAEDVARMREEIAKADMYGLSPEQIVFVLATELEIQTRPEQELTEQQQQEKNIQVNADNSGKGTENTPDNHMLTLAQQLHKKNLYFANHGEQKGDHGDAYHGVYVYVTNADGNQRVVLDTCESCTNHQDLGVENVAEQIESQAAKVRDQRIQDHQERQAKFQQQQEQATAPTPTTDDVIELPPYEQLPGGGYIPNIYVDPYVTTGRSGGAQRPSTELARAVPVYGSGVVRRIDTPSRGGDRSSFRSSGSDGGSTRGRNGSLGEPVRNIGPRVGRRDERGFRNVEPPSTRARARRDGGDRSQRSGGSAQRFSGEPVLKGGGGENPRGETGSDGGISVTVARDKKKPEGERVVAKLRDRETVFRASRGKTMVSREAPEPEHPVLRVIGRDGGITTVTTQQTASEQTTTTAVQEEPDIGSRIALAMATAAAERSSSFRGGAAYDKAPESDGSQAGQTVQVGKVSQRGMEVAADSETDTSPAAPAAQGGEPVRGELRSDEQDGSYALSPSPEPGEPAGGRMAVKLEAEATKRLLVISEGDDGGSGIALEAPAVEPEQLRLNGTGDGDDSMARTAPEKRTQQKLNIDDTDSGRGGRMVQEVSAEQQRIGFDGSNPDGSGGMAKSTKQNRSMNLGAEGGTGDGNGAMAKTSQRTRMTAGSEGDSGGGSGARAQQREESRAATMTTGEGGPGDRLTISSPEAQARNEQSKTTPGRQARVGGANGEGGQSSRVESQTGGVRSQESEAGRRKPEARSQKLKSKARNRPPFGNWSTPTARNVEEMTQQGKAVSGKATLDGQQTGKEATSSEDVPASPEAGTYEAVKEGNTSPAYSLRRKRAARQTSRNAHSVTQTSDQTDDTAAQAQPASDPAEDPLADKLPQKVKLTQRNSKWTTPTEHQARRVNKKTQTGKIAEAKQLEVNSTPHPLDISLQLRQIAKELGYDGRIRVLQPPPNKSILTIDMNTFRKVLYAIMQSGEGNVLVVGWKSIGKYVMPIVSGAQNANTARYQVRADRRRAVSPTEMKLSRRLA